MKQYELFINGEFVPNGSREMIKVINPATEEVISEVPKATEEDVARAVDAAYEAQKSWAKRKPGSSAEGRRSSGMLEMKAPKKVPRSISRAYASLHPISATGRQASSLWEMEARIRRISAARLTARPSLRTWYLSPISKSRCPYQN